MRPHAPLAISLLLLLGACDQFADRPVPVATVAAVTEPAIPPAPVLPPTLIAVPPLPAEKPRPGLSFVKAGIAAETAALPPASFDPESLLGLDFGQTEGLLGVPARRADRPPAKVWTYVGEDCELSVFFYADLNTRQFRALTYEIKPGAEPGATEEQCQLPPKQQT